MEARAVTTFVCRTCHADLDVDAKFCGQCGAPTAERQAEIAGSTAHNRLLDRPWFLIVLVLRVGVLGIPAYWQTKYSAATRLLIIIASILYTLFAIVVIVWSVQQILALF